MKAYSAIADKVWKALAYILAGLMAALVVIVFWQIICRYVLRASNGWTQEISTLLFVWATFLGASLSVRSGAQIAMKVLLQKMPRISSNIMSFIAAVICEAFYVILTWSGVAAMQLFSDASTPALRIPMAVPYLAIAFSGIAMLFFGIGEIAKPVWILLKSKEEK